MKTHEQFDKLAEQCYVKTGSVQTDHFDYVKFAELIVRECMEQLNISNVPAPISAGLNLGKVAIKEHFGVEE